MRWRRRWAPPQLRSPATVGRNESDPKHKKHTTVRAPISWRGATPAESMSCFAAQKLAPSVHTGQYQTQQCQFTALLHRLQALFLLCTHEQGAATHQQKHGRLGIHGALSRLASYEECCDTFDCCGPTHCNTPRCTLFFASFHAQDR